MRVNIDVLHIVEDSGGSTFSAQGAPASDDAREIVMIDFVKKIRKKLIMEIRELVNKEVLNKVEVKIAHYEHTLESLILNYKADLIIMGTEGFHASREIFISSVTEQVVDEAPVPVIVVRQDTPVSNYDHVVYASHFDEVHADELTNLASFLKNLNARIDLVKVSDEVPNEGEKRRLNDVAMSLQFNEAGSSAEIIRSSKPEEAIERYMDVKQGDLLTLNAHHLGGIARFFRKNIVEHFINRFNRPVMVLNFP